MAYLHYIIYALIAWNLIIFLLYGLDKRKAKNRKRRISEKALLMVAFFMGGVGAMSGMLFYRHKTQHRKFKILLPLFVLSNVIITVAGYYFAT